MRIKTREFIWGLTLFILGFFLVIFTTYSYVDLYSDTHLYINIVFNILAVLLIALGAFIINRNLE